MLRNPEIHCIHNLWIRNIVVQIFTKDFQYGLYCISFVVNQKPFYIFQEEGFRLLPKGHRTKCTS